MKREIRQISDDGKTIRVTTPDSRWYIKTLEDGSIVEFPSVTWICNSYPKSESYYRWLSAQGFDNAEAISQKAMRKGSKIHEAISLLLLENTLKLDDKLHDPETGELEEITAEEWEAIMSFTDWYKEVKPKMIVNEFVVFGEEPRCGGTVDFVCEIDGVRYLIDFKSGKGDIWPSYEIQVSAYSHMLPPEMKPEKLAILHVGYERNRKGWKFTEIEDQYDLFLAAHRIWKKEQGMVKLPQKEYPLTLSL